MPRCPRIHLPDGWYHVTSRGNEHRIIFREDRDRTHFVGLLGQMVQTFSIRLHAYVLMDNHHHLLVATPSTRLSRAMQWLNASYGVWINKRHQRVGHLFQGRFKSIVLDAAQWALGLSRYVHLNPVRTRQFGLDKATQKVIRAGRGARPKVETVKQRIQTLRAYRWSSYRAYLGLEKAPSWLAWGSVLELTGGRTRSSQRRVYRQYAEQAVREGLDESPWEELQEGLALGGAEFIERIRANLAVKETAKGSVTLPVEPPGFERVKTVVEQMKGERWQDFRDRKGDWGRDVALYVARKRCALGLRELGVAVGGVGATSVSMAVKRLEERAEAESKLRALIERAVEMLGL